MLSRYSHRLGVGILILVAFLYISIVDLHAQQTISGPYTPDSATVLLMHFDGDLQNGTDRTATGKAVGDISFTDLREEGSEAFGQQLRIHNSSANSISPNHVWIPDTTTLDLTGNWTIEMWVMVFS